MCARLGLLRQHLVGSLPVTDGEHSPAARVLCGCVRYNEYLAACLGMHVTEHSNKMAQQGDAAL